jgi:hypothetical protein
LLLSPYLLVLCFASDHFPSCIHLHYCLCISFSKLVPDARVHQIKDIQIEIVYAFIYIWGFASIKNKKLE